MHVTFLVTWTQTVKRYPFPCFIAVQCTKHSFLNLLKSIIWLARCLLGHSAKERNERAIILLSSFTEIYSWRHYILILPSTMEGWNSTIQLKSIFKKISNLSSPWCIEHFICCVCQLVVRVFQEHSVRSEMNTEKP